MTKTDKMTRTVTVLVLAALGWGFFYLLDMPAIIDRAFPHVKNAGLLFLGVWFLIYIMYRLWVIWLLDILPLD